MDDSKIKVNTKLFKIRFIDYCLNQNIERNWREVQKIFLNNSQLLAELDNAENIIKEGKIDKNSIKISNYYI